MSAQLFFRAQKHSCLENTLNGELFHLKSNAQETEIDSKKKVGQRRALIV